MSPDINVRLNYLDSKHTGEAGRNFIAHAATFDGPRESHMSERFFGRLSVTSLADITEVSLTTSQPEAISLSRAVTVEQGAELLVDEVARSFVAHAISAHLKCQK